MKMKKYILSVLCLTVIGMMVSCNKFDNYDAPDGTISGKVIDNVTGNPIITEQPHGFRIKYDEISWSDLVEFQFKKAELMLQ